MTNEQPNTRTISTKTKPARIWIGTIPYSPEYDLFGRFNGFVAYAIGQRELGANTNYEHWQIVIHCLKPNRLTALKKHFGDQCHWEPTLSAAAESYVHKDDTAIADTRFTWGKKPINRASAKDWDLIRADCVAGRLDAVPSDIFVRCYSNIRRIAADFAKPIAMERQCRVYWGTTGVGKSRRAWDEASMEAYPKDPRTKFWDGYDGQTNVVIDEFRGGIDIGHLLRWLDRYPVIVEIKGSSTCLKATTIWITSNLHPREWYPTLDGITYAALERRLNILELTSE